MVYMELPEKYRADAAELVKLFLPNGSFSFVDCAPGTLPGDLILKLEIENSTGLSELKLSFQDNNHVLHTDTMPVDASNSEHDKELKMSLKLLIYRCLTRYTEKTLPWGVLTGIRPVKIVHSLLSEGWTEADVLSRLMEYYRVSEDRALLAIETARNERKLLEGRKHSVSVYTGIPFCAGRCLYCSFPSVSTDRYGYLTRSYLKALEKELRWTAEWLAERKIPLDTVYMGGGTPTALSEEELNLLLSGLVSVLPMDGAREFTVEAGRPDTLNREKFRIMKKAGVTRISINPQTMQDKTLRLIGRNHNAGQIVTAYNTAREEGFGNINCDLIAGLPEETEDDFQDTLVRIGELNPESVTVHTMSVKRASRLHEEQESFTRTPDEVVSNMIGHARRFLNGVGMQPYYLYRQKNILANLENVGYAKPGYEGIYNILIMEEVQSILALGAGAISKLLFPNGRIERIFNVRNVEQYIDRIDEMIERKKQMLDSFQLS